MGTFGASRPISRRAVVVGGAALAMATALPACGEERERNSSPGDELATPMRGAAARQTLTVVDPFEPKSYLDAGGHASPIQEGVAEGLVRVSFDLEFEGALARAWESPDPLTWLFRLRDGVAFQSGEPLKGEAVVKALQRFAGLKGSGSTPGGKGTPLERATIDSPEPGLVRVVTQEPFPALLAYLASGPAVVYTPASYDGDPGTTLPVGTGPFRLTAFRPGDRRELEAFDGYWAGVPGLKSVRYLVVPEAPTRLTMLLGGDADLALVLNAQDIPTLEGRREVAAVTQQLPRFRALYFNTKRGATSDPRIRKAIGHAIDRDLLVRTVLARQGAVQDGLFRPEFPWGNAQLRGVPYDPLRSKQLLAEAGFGPGNPLRVTLSTYTARRELPDVAQAIQKQLEAVGVECQLDVGEWDALEPRALAGQTELVLLARNPLLIFDPQAFYRTDYSAHGSFNLSQYDGAEDLLERLGRAYQPEERYELFRQIAQRIIERDLATLVISSYVGIEGVRASVSGYRPHPLELARITYTIVKS